MSDNTPWSAWYRREPWTGPNGIRSIVLRRDPICKCPGCPRCDRRPVSKTVSMCIRPSTNADHIIPHRGDWALFTDTNNVRGNCQACHSCKTATHDGGFGNKPKDPNDPVPTGEPGKQGITSSVGEDALDRALAEDE